MNTIQNIHSNLTSTVQSLSMWVVTLCSRFVIDFGYSNEPKQGGSWSGYNIS